MTTDIPIKDPEQNAQIGYQIDVRGELGHNHPDTDLRMVYNKSEDKTYCFVATVDEELHVYREKNIFRNDWERLSPTAGYPWGLSGGANINQPLVTKAGTLLLPDNGTPALKRTEDWGRTEPETVHPNAPLATRHSQDTFGDIFFAEYNGPNDGDHSIIKSSDDGQTWETIATQIGDTHMHLAAPSQRDDLVFSTSGHDHSEVELCRKDGSDHVAGSLIPQDFENTSAIGNLMPYSTSGLRSTLNTADLDVAENVFVAHDANTPYITRTRLGLEAGTNDYVSEVNYSTSFDSFHEASPFVGDIDVVEGYIVGTARTGHLYVSPDGWRWSKIPVTAVGMTDKYMNFFTETKSHLIIEALNPVILPKSRLHLVNPRGQTIMPSPVSPSGPISQGEILMHGIPTEDVRTIRVAGIDGEEGRIDGRFRNGSVRRTETLLEFGAGGGHETNEIDVYGQQLEEVFAATDLTDTLRFSIDLLY